MTDIKFEIFFFKYNMFLEFDRSTLKNLKSSRSVKSRLCKDDADRYAGVQQARIVMSYARLCSLLCLSLF